VYRSCHVCVSLRSVADATDNDSFSQRTFNDKHILLTPRILDEISTRLIKREFFLLCFLLATHNKLSHLMPNATAAFNIPLRAFDIAPALHPGCSDVDRSIAFGAKCATRMRINMKWFARVRGHQGKSICRLKPNENPQLPQAEVVEQSQSSHAFSSGRPFSHLSGPLSSRFYPRKYSRYVAAA